MNMRETSVVTRRSSQPRQNSPLFRVKRVAALLEEGKSEQEIATNLYQLGIMLKHLVTKYLHLARALDPKVIELLDDKTAPAPYTRGQLHFTVALQISYLSKEEQLAVAQRVLQDALPSEEACKVVEEQLVKQAEEQQRLTPAVLALLQPMDRLIPEINMLINTQVLKGSEVAALRGRIRRLQELVDSIATPPNLGRRVAFSDALLWSHGCVSTASPEERITWLKSFVESRFLGDQWK